MNPLTGIPRGRAGLRLLLGALATATFGVGLSDLILYGLEQKVLASIDFAAPIGIKVAFLSGPFSLLVWFGLSGFFVVLLAYTSFLLRTQLVQIPSRASLQMDSRFLQQSIRDTGISRSAGSDFWMCLSAPEMISRISESIEFSTRSFLVRTSVVFKPPVVRFDDRFRVLPVMLVARGSTNEEIRVFTSSDSRVPTLSHFEVASHLGAVIESLISAAGSRALRAYRVSAAGQVSLEGQVVSHLADASASRINQAGSLALAISALPSRPASVALLRAAGHILTIVARDYPVCVKVGSESSAMRFTVERSVVSPTVNASQRVQASGQIPLQLDDRFPASRLLLQLASLRQRSTQLLRNMLGVQVTTLELPLNQSLRTASYHLHVAGPLGHYLAAQELRDSSDLGRGLTIAELRRAEYSMARRLGQRSAHLYVRNASLPDTTDLALRFFERMPGSLATASVASFTAAICIAVIGSRQIQELAHAPSMMSDVSGLLQILLAFPLAITATSNFRIGAPFWGGDLGARSSTAAIVALLLGALIIANAANVLPFEAVRRSWYVVETSAVMVFLASLVLWISRAATAHSFLRRS